MKRTDNILILLLLFAGIINFSWGLQGKFVYDDLPFIVENSAIKNLSNIPSFFTSRFSMSPEGRHSIFRPLRTLSFAIDYALWGLNPFGYHLTNLILHTVNGILFFFLLKKILKHIKNIHTRFIPFIGAFIFLAHPIQSEPVFWISARADLLCGLFSFLGLLFYIGPEHSQPKSINQGLSLLFYLCGLLSKETTAILIFVFILYDQISGRKRNFLFYAACATALCGFVLLRHMALGELLPPEMRPVFLFKKIYIWVFTFGLALQKLLIPLNLSADYAFQKPIPGWIVFLCFLAFSSCIFWIIHRIKIRGALDVFFLAWFLLTFLPSLGLPITRGFFAERFLYIGAGCIAFFAAICFWRILEPMNQKQVRNKIAALLLVFLALGFLYKNVERAKVWKNSLALWEDTVRKSPENYRAYLNLGAEYQMQNKLPKALELFHRAYEIEPSSFQATNNLGTAYGALGKYEESEYFLRKSLQLEPGNLSAVSNLGYLYFLNERYTESETAYLACIRMAPTAPGCWTGLNEVYKHIYSPDSQNEKLLQLEHQYPNSYVVLYLRGDYARRTKNPEQALQCLTASEKLNPYFAETLLALAYLYAEKNDKLQATNYLQKFLKLRPGSPQAYEILKLLEKI